MVYNFTSFAALRQSGVATTVLFTIPQGQTGVLRSISLVNSGAEPVTLNVTLEMGGVQLHAVSKNLTLPVGHKYDDNSAIVLPAGTVGRLETSTPNGSVDAILSGVQG